MGLHRRRVRSTAVGHVRLGLVTAVGTRPRGRRPRHRPRAIVIVYFVPTDPLLLRGFDNAALPMHAPLRKLLQPQYAKNWLSACRTTRNEFRSVFCTVRYANKRAFDLYHSKTRHTIFHAKDDRKTILLVLRAGYA